ncbi:MAG TPA: ABC transporter permease, partial [Clostridia bacterium]|nr:ABC transporter permease [Clostridia bacterium]
WVQTGKEGPQGVEATGQRIIFLFGQMFVFFVALLPAALAGLLVFFLAQWLLGSLAAILATALVAAGVLAVEAALGLMLLGQRFERLDISAEPAA